MFPGKFSDHWETALQGTEVNLSGMLKWSFHEIVTLSRTFLYFLVIVVVMWKPALAEPSVNCT